MTNLINVSKDLQTKMREYCIKDFNKVYGLYATLVEKQKGRNQDYRKNQMNNYNELVSNFNKQQKKINKVNESNIKLENKSKEITNIIDNLKPSKLNKNNCTISNENKQLLLEYIDNVKDVNKNVKDITSYSISVEKIKDDFENNYSAIDELHSTIREQKKEINNLKSDLTEKNKIIEQQDNTINNLNNNVFNLSMEVQKWKNKFNKVINFIKNKVLGIFGNQDKDFYKNMADNMLINNVIEEKDYNKIINKSEKKRNDDYCDINSTLVYPIENLFIQKLGAYMQRDKLRDLYDVTFIYHNYDLSEELIRTAKEFVGFKGLEQVEYLLKTDEDPLIDKEKLTNDFLEMYNGLGLFDYYEEESESDQDNSDIEM